MIQLLRKLLCLFLFVVTANVTISQNKITVAVNKPIAPVPATMWGIFFEDINFAADGGLYAELIKNRSFEFHTPLMGWRELRPQAGTAKSLIINQGGKSPHNSRYVDVTLTNSKGYGLQNEGFRGIGVKKDKQYNFSIIARKPKEGDVKIRVELVDTSGKKIGEASLGAITDKWIRHNASFNSSATVDKARLNIYFEGNGQIDIDMISLFPQDTWKNRPFGLRADLVQMLADLRPGFIRFPGGCIVEGHELETRYQWKRTVGLPENRTPIINRWNTEFKHRLTADYYQTFGLGFFEYFQLAEDLGAEALPILNCGMACQFNTKEVAPMDQLDPYIQDALDLIEFANGSDTSKWGKIRAEMGHPKPFNLKFLGVGNEQWDEQYIERYKVFADTLKKKYPNLKLVSGSGPDPDGARFNYAWKELKALQTDLIDEHYYRPPAWFLSNASRYDNYDRKGPKVFAGEYAAHGKEDKDPESKNTWISALSEAAFMTGLERNADIVEMASYAPLFAHVEAWQWRPDMIWFDNLRTVGTPNYYVQKLFSTNSGTHVIPALKDGNVLNGKDSIYASAVINKPAGEVIVKVVNTSSIPVTYDIDVTGAKPSAKEGSMQVLRSVDPMAYNTLNQQQNIYPVDSRLKVKGSTVQVNLQPMSMNVIKVPVKL